VDLESFEGVPTATCLLDEQGRVLKLNRAFRDYLDEHDYIQDAQPGVLISCIHAVKPGPGCGRTLSCSECVLRNAINSCVRSGVSIDRVRMPVRREGTDEGAVLLISINRATLQGQTRLVLSVEDITDAERRVSCASTDA
jgi:hypothetical protein